MRQVTMADLRYKEVINVRDGGRVGYVGDLALDLESGTIRALIVPGRRRFLGLLGKEPDKAFPWESIRRLGDDIILVEADTRVHKK